jgi:hypothetical protein
LGVEAWKVDIRLPGKGNSTSQGARPVEQNISIIKWIRTSRLSMKKSLSVVTHNEGVARLATRKRALSMNSNPRCNTPRFQEWYRISVPIGTARHLRIAT